MDIEIYSALCDYMFSMQANKLRVNNQKPRMKIK